MRNKAFLFVSAIALTAFTLTANAQENINSTYSQIKPHRHVRGKLTYTPTAVVHGGYNNMHFPYPVIFMHGLIGSAESWNNFKAYATQQGWSYGGKLPFCLNESHHIYFDSTDNITKPNQKEVRSFIPANLPAADFYAITFNTDTDGTNYDRDSLVSTTESAEAAITKGGMAIGMAVKAVLKATGKDKVILFCHSMGGLDARAYIQTATYWQSDGQHHIAKLTTSGTPHGGSNVWGGAIIDGYEQVDEQSDGVRDTRTSYSQTGSPGVFLFGGVEDTTAMDDSFFFDFNSFDVNCNGKYGDTIVGINQRPMPADIDYTCIISDYNMDITDSCGDYLVLCQSAQIKNYFPTLKSETFMVDTFHDDLPDLIHANYLGLDEPDSSNLAFNIDTNIIYNGFISIQAPDASHSIDYDNYTFTINQPGVANILINYIPVDTFGYNITSMPGGAVVYSYNSIGDSSMASPPISLTAGTYNLQIWGNPNETSWQKPYDFIVKYVPGIESIHAYNNNDAPNLSVFPNPVTNILTVKAPPKSQLEICNVEGQQIQAFVAADGKTKIDVSAFPRGVFLIKAINENGIAVMKFVKE
jgi:pimeloyl-ACP methyl ester carboxylesterase